MPSILICNEVRMVASLITRGVTMKKLVAGLSVLPVLLVGCGQSSVSKPSWKTVHITRDPAWLVPYVVLPEEFHIHKPTDKPKISESQALQMVEDMYNVPPYPHSINISYVDSSGSKREGIWIVSLVGVDGVTDGPSAPPKGTIFVNNYVVEPNGTAYFISKSTDN